MAQLELDFDKKSIFKKFDYTILKNDFSRNFLCFNKNLNILSENRFSHIEPLHLHVKMTNKCPHNCRFCIEKQNRNDAEDSGRLLKNLSAVSKTLMSAKLFNSMSITGGEPFTDIELLRQIIAIAKNINPDVFLTINTSVRRVDAALNPSYFNISDHILRDDIPTNLTNDDIVQIKNSNPESEVRVQCVLFDDSQLDLIFPYIDDRPDLKYIEIRDLMNQATTFNDWSEIMKKFINMLLNNDECYFINRLTCFYETNLNFKYKNCKITLASSNMKYLDDLEQHESNNLIRELIFTPDGKLSGSWFKKNRKAIIS